MNQNQFEFIEPANISQIIPLLMQVNKKTPADILELRLKEMVTQNYKCLGIFDDGKLIGICGLWFMTRHYCGRSIEPDHIMIDPEYQGKGIGHQLFEWIFKYAKENNFEASELNTYVNNTGSHKLYYNLGYVIKGYHFVKLLE
ncbi:MAG: GNAT family N-acetyltransferase [Crocinitomicaceae bacterium]|nr:GNAT family N-acetyltransferase [Crocinitomicaceae bacterium]